jgi:phosphatidylglycerophosphate synthase
VSAARLGLAIGAVFLSGGPSADPPAGLRGVVVGLLAVSRLLDLLDGAVARKTGEVTRAGALIDLSADLLTHTLVWWLSGLAAAPALVGLEWAAGLCIGIRTVRGTASWKRALAEESGRLMRIYFGRNQRNALSAFANFSHFAAPMAAYAGAGPLVFVFVPGLVLYEVVTVLLIREALRHNKLS